MRINKVIKINISAARSLEERYKETLTLHKLGLVEELGTHLCTTNQIENLNSQLVKYVNRIKYWRGDMLYRWIATSLLEIEQKMNRIMNFKKLYLLTFAPKSQLNLAQINIG